MTFYQELQLNQAGSKSLLKNSKSITTPSTIIIKLIQKELNLFCC